MEANRSFGIRLPNLSAPPRLRIDFRFPWQSGTLRQCCQALLFSILYGTSFAQSPVLNRSEPLALAPGKTTALALLGERLVPDGTLWISFPAQFITNNSSDHASTFRVTLGPNVPSGIGALQLVNSNGVSNFRLVLVDPLPSLVDVRTNTMTTNAQALPLPTAVDGYCAELESHFYRIHLDRKQRVAIEVVANQIGSLLDPFLRVLDIHGHELGSVDDTPGCGADGYMEFIAPKAGVYMIEVRDTRYAGGPNFFFHLRVGNIAVKPWRFLPLAEPLPGPTADALPIYRTPGSETNTRRPKEGERQHGVQSRDGSNSPRTPEVADIVQPPILIQGRFDFPGRRDVFEFPTKKDERWIIRGRTRSLGSPCDLYLRLEKPDGSRIIESDATGADEGGLTNKFAETGTARLVVEELNRGGGPGFDYQIEIIPFEPGFSLTVATNTVSVPPGESFELKVSAVRRDFDGAITLSLAGPVEGCSLTNNVIAEKQKETTMKVTAPVTSTAGTLLNFAIVGVGRISERRIEVRASTMAVLKDQFPQMLLPSRELDGSISLGVKPGGANSK